MITESPDSLFQLPSKNLPKVEIFTDGGCEPNPGFGAWAAVLRTGSNFKEITGHEKQTTNNRMEMTAVIRAIECLNKPSLVTVFTDSMVVCGVINGTGKKPHKRKNQDLVMELIALKQTHDITASWIKGHSGHPENTHCDWLCSEQIRNASPYKPKIRYSGPFNSQNDGPNKKYHQGFIINW